ncbi:MAG: glycosyl hydrolase family 28-related protein, partial [Armatimonadota bacterium]
MTTRPHTPTSAIAVLLLTAALTVTCLEAAPQRPASSVGTNSIAFPKDRSVVDAKRDLGAKGDGITDDTAALQKGIEASCGADGGATKVLFLPNGVYRVTKTLVVKSPLGPWLYGQSRDGVVIRLADGVTDCNSVLRTHPLESGKTSADWFMRNIRNLTIDVGNNPSTDGIRYYATNSGIISNVRVTGHGKVGINAGFLDQSGPNLIQDTVIEGFETGLYTAWIWGETISRVTIRNCRKQGVVVNANAVGIEDLTVENTPQALSCDYPNDWTWWGGVVALIGGRFTGGDPSAPAILNKNVLYARDVKTTGYKQALESSTPGGSIAAGDIVEYSSHEVKKTFDAPAGSLRLPIKPEPKLPWETNPTNWVCANDFGAVAGDNKDDTEALQEAVDVAAAAHKTTVYLRGVGGAEPNWYNLEGEVRVHGSVRHVLSLGWGRILGGPSGKFVVGYDAAPVVKFQNFDSFGGPPPTVENRSAKHTMVVESCGVTILGTGGGDIFATDCPARVDLRQPGQKMWARHLNPEGNDDV